VVVVVDEPAVGDIGDVEQPLDRGAGQDGGGRRGDVGRRDQIATGHPRFEGEQLGFDLGDQLQPAGGVTPFTRRGEHHHVAACPRRWSRAPSSRTVPPPPTASSSALGGLGEHGGDVFAAAQLGGEQPVTLGGFDLGDVVVGDQPAVGDHTDPPDREPSVRSSSTPFEGGGVLGAAGEHVMGDRDPVRRGEQPDHHLRPVATPVAGVAERLGRKPGWGAGSPSR
jgi:hypothetical protein